MIPKLNDKKWYKQMLQFNIDRSSLLGLVGLLELALRHPHLPKSSRERGVKIGRAFAWALLDDGLIVPDKVRISWEKTFNIPFTVDPDLIIDGLTDQDGHPWK